MALSPGLGTKYSPLILTFKSANRGRILHSMQEAQCLQGMQPKRRDCLLPERVGGAAGKQMVVSGCLHVQLERIGNLARGRIQCVCAHALICSVVSNKLFCPWDFRDKNTGVGFHFLLQGISLTQGLSPSLLHWQADFLPLCHLGNRRDTSSKSNILQ